jgi:hypothetical protein
LLSATLTARIDPALLKDAGSILGGIGVFKGLYKTNIIFVLQNF